MKCTVILDKNREEEILIYANEKNEIINQIEQLVSAPQAQLTGYLEGEIFKLEFEN